MGKVEKITIKLAMLFIGLSLLFPARVLAAEKNEINEITEKKQIIFFTFDNELKNWKTNYINGRRQDVQTSELESNRKNPQEKKCSEEIRTSEPSYSRWTLETGSESSQRSSENQAPRLKVETA